jgi:LysM repeat protein
MMFQYHRRLSFILAFWSLLLPSVAQSEPYRVQKGDSLSAIAVRYGVSVQTLASVNHLPNPNHIVVGKTLIIPEHSVAALVHPKPVQLPQHASRRSGGTPDVEHPFVRASDEGEIQMLRDGLSAGWVVTRNDEGMLFVHTGRSNGFLTGLKYVVRESADGAHWTVHRPKVALDGTTAYGRTIGVIRTPNDVPVGRCTCR